MFIYKKKEDTNTVTHMFIDISNSIYLYILIFFSARDYILNNISE